MDDMEPPGCPDPAKVVIFKISPLASLANSANLFNEASSSFSAQNLSLFIYSLPYLDES
jgi:hypothetical protein